MKRPKNSDWIKISISHNTKGKIDSKRQKGQSYDNYIQHIFTRIYYLTEQGVDIEDKKAWTKWVDKHQITNNLFTPTYKSGI